MDKSVLKSYNIIILFKRSVFKMRYDDDPFISDLMVNVGVLGKIIITIVLRVKHIISPFSMPLFVVMIVLSTLIPFGGTIAFIVLKLTRLINLGWPWIIAALVLDSLVFPAYSSINT